MCDSYGMSQAVWHQQSAERRRSILQTANWTIHFRNDRQFIWSVFNFPFELGIMNNILNLYVYQHKQDSLSNNMMGSVMVLVVPSFIRLPVQITKYKQILNFLRKSFANGSFSLIQYVGQSSTSSHFQIPIGIIFFWLPSEGLSINPLNTVINDSLVSLQLFCI